METSDCTMQSNQMKFQSIPIKEFCLGVFLVCGFLCFLPYYLDRTADYSAFDPQSRFNWKEYRFLILSSSSAALPMMFDTALDYNIPFHQALPRWTIVLTLTITNLIPFFYLRQLSDYSISLAVCCIFAKAILVKGALLSYILHDGCSMRTVREVLLISVFYIAGLYVKLWKIFDTNGVTVWMLTVSNICTGVSQLVLFFICVRRCYRWRFGKQPSGGLQTFYAVLSFCDTLIKYLVVISFKQPTYMVIVEIGLCILATSIPGREARHQRSIAEHTIKSKRNFVSYISHELRTPLNIVYMGIQLLAANLKDFKGFDTDDTLDIVKDVEGSCRVAIDILDDFLMVNKIEGNNLALERELVPVMDLLHSVVNPFDIQARQNNVKFLHSGSGHIDPAIHDTMVNVDISKFSQVIRNLVSNSLKFTPPGGQVNLFAYLKSKPSAGSSGSFNFPMGSLIECASSGHNGRILDETIAESGVRRLKRSGACVPDCSIVRIEVHDTGPGISQENQKRLFTEIIQFNANKLQNGGGSGLGLWISNSIMKLHGGCIGVESTMGKGSMFFIEIDVASYGTDRSPRLSPCNQCSQRNKYRSIVEVDCSGVEGDWVTCLSQEGDCEVGDKLLERVLIVDDSSVNRKMLSRLIAPNARHIFQAENGSQAVDMVAKSKDQYDLIFMDVNMPIMGGIEATTRIREIGCKCYIVFLTGNAMPEDRESYVAAGGDNVLIKPCSINDVDNIVQSLLRRNCTS